MNPENQTTVREEKKPKGKTYSSPKLVEYGSIAKLTQGSGATTADATLMTCL